MPDGRSGRRAGAAAVLGRSDCERIRDGFLAQPVNALSSLAFLPAALAVARRATTARHPSRALLRACAVSLAAAGLGSVEYHGPQHRGARRLHDLSLAATAAGLLLLTLHGTRTGPVPPRALRRPASLALVAAAAYGAGRTGSPLCRPGSRLQLHAGWHLAAAAAAVALVDAVAPRCVR
jgi:hypothetical protein